MTAEMRNYLSIKLILADKALQSIEEKVNSGIISQEDFESKLNVILFRIKTLSITLSLN